MWQQPLQFARGVFRHWVFFATSSVAAALLSFLPGVGYRLTHSVYWSAAGVGWLIAFYRAWRDERQQVESLTKRLNEYGTERKREAETRELIEVITALRNMKNRVQRWRDIANGQWGMAPPAEKLVPENISDVVFWVGKVSSELRKEVEDIAAEVARADDLISTFQSQLAAYRQESLMRQAYPLLNEAATRLPRVIAALESAETSRS